MREGVRGRGLLGGLASSALVAATVLAATLLTLIADRFAAETLYVFFVAAVALVAWQAGWRLGLATLALSLFAVDFLFIAPIGSLRLHSVIAVSRLLSLALVSLAMIGITRALRKERQRADAAACAAQEARDATERVSEERARFLRTLWHEVRTPLNAVLGYVDLLDAGTAGALAAEQVALLRRVRLAGHHLVRVVNGVLDIAKAESGHLSVEHARLAVSSVVDASRALTAPQADAKHLTVTVQDRDDSLTCVGDADHVRQILINLLSNAVKFTPDRGRVAISSGRTVAGTPGVWIRVCDSGPGISIADQERICRPFEKANGRPAGNQEGAGLGLAISRQLACLQGGSLAVSSEPGRGACFTLTLPSEDVGHANGSGAHSPGGR
jgi:signal transduction histidine kinase